MKKNNFEKHLTLAWLLFFMVFSSFSPLAFAAGHGCSNQEADRDGDGIPDRTDDFPDDPSRTGKESAGDVRKGCGDQVPVMRLFFIPFNGEGAMTAEGIESSSVTSLIACSEDGIGGTIKNILGETPSAGTSSAAPDTSSDSKKSSAGSSDSTDGQSPAGTATSQTSAGNTSDTDSSVGNTPAGTPSSGGESGLENLGAPLGPGGGIFPAHDSILKTFDCATRVVNGKIVPCKEIFGTSLGADSTGTPWPASYDQVWKDEKCGQKDAEGNLTFCVPTDKGIVVVKAEADKNELFILQLQNLGVPLPVITGIISGDLPALSQEEKENGLWNDSRCGQKDETGKVIECRYFGKNLLVMDSSSGMQQVSFVSLVTSADMNALPPGFLSSGPEQSNASSNPGSQESLGEDVFYCGEMDPWGRKIECRNDSKGLRVTTLLGGGVETLSVLGFASSNNKEGDIGSVKKEGAGGDLNPSGAAPQAAQCGVPDKDGIYQKCLCEMPNHDKKLNKEKIRLKAEFPSEKITFFADAEGRVLKTHSDKKITDLSCLSKYQMKMLEKEIRKAGGNVDLSGKAAPKPVS